MATNRHVRSKLIAVALLCAIGATRTARGDEVDDARKTFTSAYTDEKAGHFGEALEKFRVVQRTKDTTSVRYRIAACLDGLHRMQNAHDAYLAVAEVAKPEDASVVESARARAKEIEARLGELALRVDGAAAESNAIIDGVTRPLKGGAGSYYLEPGPHRVAIEAGGEPSVETTIAVEAGRTTVLVLDRRGRAASAPTPPPTGAPAAPPAPPAGTSPVDSGPSSTRTIGAIGVGLGVALVVGSVIAFVVRESSISDIETACPEGRCPRSREGDVTSASSRARTLLPVAIVTGATGVSLLGGGLYFALRPTTSRSGSAVAIDAMSFDLGGSF